MTEFTKQVIDIISSVPKGKVLTYGKTAALAGNPKGARQVARILHSMSQKYNLPWHRIINSTGKISIKDEQGRNLQESLLIEEGVQIDQNGTVNLKIFLLVTF